MASFLSGSYTSDTSKTCAPGYGPDNGSASSTSWHDVKRALVDLNVVEVLADGKDIKPLPLRGKNDATPPTPIDQDTRKEGIMNLWSEVNDLAFNEPDLPRELLNMALCRALEHRAAYQAKPRDEIGHAAAITTLKSQLALFGSGGTRNIDVMESLTKVKELMQKAKNMASEDSQTHLNPLYQASCTALNQQPSSSTPVHQSAVSNPVQQPSSSIQVQQPASSIPIKQPPPATPFEQSTPADALQQLFQSISIQPSSSRTDDTPSSDLNPVEPNAMEAEPTNAPVIALNTPSSPPAAVGHDSAYHHQPAVSAGSDTAPLHQPTVEDVMECDDFHDLEPRPLKLAQSPSQTLELIPEHTREHAVFFMIDSFKPLNRRAAKKHAERLTEEELAEMTDDGS
ncbi:hypothetical protein EK21DRAFT_117313 [Setomelanomma holmii]|uniref:Uncharacterized protein n=1 Tax=Setomelanomma holmii TaxID=210430 RepID=A0A9P4LI98_9PLEO|nr:hypothetical protein EK21DRAFT_117313 [Setomelanomma holmii]